MSVMQTEKGEYVNNNIICPCCGSDMKRDCEDNPHIPFIGHYTCLNNECAISITLDK